MGFQCLACRESLLDAQVIFHIADRFEKEGADAFFKYEPEELLPAGTRCPHCQEKKFKKENDILDVWFDSGVSFAAVLEKIPSLQFPADIYLEGSDQHRGWFHSSLLASVGTRGKAPYKTVLTHGFVVDGEGRKYSKSAKNYTSPDKVINKLGAEILRLWVAAEDYRNDIRFSEEILDRLTETYRKIRNTCRFLLGNLYDFDPDAQLLPVAERLPLDRWAISALQDLIARITQAFEEYEFHVIYHALNQFCTVTLSSFYLDILKDRLYVSKATGPERRAAQSTLYDILSALCPLMAPLLSFTAEEVHQYLGVGKEKRESVFLLPFPKADPQRVDKGLMSEFDQVTQIRQEVTKALEMARKDKLIGHSLDAQVMITAEGKWQKFLQERQQDWAEIFIVSQVVVVYELENPSYESTNLEGLKIKIKKAEGEKCQRCWIHTITVGKARPGEMICERCAKVLYS